MNPPPPETGPTGTNPTGADSSKTKGDIPTSGTQSNNDSEKPSNTDQQTTPLHSNDPNNDPQLDNLIDSAAFRILMGIPSGNSSLSKVPGLHHPHADIEPIKLPLHPFLPRFISRCMYPYDPEQPTSIYFTLRRQERNARFQYRVYDNFVYACLFVQLALSAALVILAALPVSHHITIAVLGAINGVIAGVLSLVKGQGMPMRLMKYADGLRKAKEEIEWIDRELRAGARTITLRQAMLCRLKYTTTRDDELRNMPDVWSSGLNDTPAIGPTSNIGKAVWLGNIPVGQGQKQQMSGLFQVGAPITGLQSRAPTTLMI
jgi:hypothetical protein